MSYLIRCAGLRGRILNTGGVVPVGWYLRSYDPEYQGGHGLAAWTENPAKAIKYLNLGEAVRAYQTVPESRPLLADGITPARPLTAFAVEFIDTADLVALS